MFLVMYASGAACTYAMGSISFSGMIRELVNKIYPSAGPRALALASVLTDIAKGFVAVTLFCTIVGHQFAQFGALFVYLGHVYPSCPNCKGGNGIGLILGAMIAVDPVVGLVSLCAWLFTYYVYRYATLAALVSAVMTPIISNSVGLGIDLQVLYLIAAIIFVRMRFKLRLLIEGKEPMVVWSVQNA